MSATVEPALRAVLIGAGRMGRAHAAALAALGIRLDAVADPRRETLDAIRDAHDIEARRLFADAETMFARIEPPDLALIATTADAHEPATRLAAQAGVPRILCEKPMASSLAACDAMIAACDGAGARLAINHQMRFMDQYTLIARELAGGRFGGLTGMTVIGGCMGLAMNGSHYVEAFRYLSGSAPREVSAWLSPETLPSPRGARFGDRAGCVRIVNGADQRLALDISADQGHGMTVTYAATHGHIFVDELEGEYVATARKPAHRAEPGTRYGMPWHRWRRRFPQADNAGPTRAVIEALIDGSAYPTGHDGRQVVATLVAAYKSDESGHGPVALDAAEDDRDRVFDWA